MAFRPGPLNVVIVLARVADLLQIYLTPVEIQVQLVKLRHFFGETRDKGQLRDMSEKETTIYTDSLTFIKAAKDDSRKRFCTTLLGNGETPIKLFYGLSSSKHEFVKGLGEFLGAGEVKAKDFEKLMWDEIGDSDE